MDQFAHAVVDDHEFVDPRAAPEPGASAGVAADRVVHGGRPGAVEEPALEGIRFGRDLALDAEYADQSLRKHADQARRDEERFHALVDETHDRAGGRVRMEGGHDEVTGEARLDGDLRGLQIPDLSHHYHVGILAEDGPQAARERHVRLLVDLGLPDAGQVVLDRVLDREDIHGAGAELGQRRVQGGGLAGAGGARHQENTVRLVHHLAQALEDVGAHAEIRQREATRLLVEQPQHDPLPVGGRQRRHAHVDLAPADAQRDPAVLGYPLFGDVELGHHLDAGHQERSHGALRADRLPQHAIDPEPHQQVAFEGLDVDVGSVLPDRLGEQRVDEADDRRVVLLLEEVLGLGDRLREAREIEIVAEAFDHLPGLDRVAGVELRETPLETFGADDLERQAASGEAAHLGQRGERRGLAAEQDNGAVRPWRRAVERHAKASCEREGKTRERDVLGSVVGHLDGA